MKRKLKIRDLFFISCLCISLRPASLQAKPPEVQVPPIQFVPPEPTRVVLKNGVVVFFLEEHELPLFSLELLMKTSPADVPEDRKGTMGLLGTVWRTGGTKKRSPDELNEELEKIAASLETGAGEEMVSLSLNCLSKDTTQSLGIFKDVLLNPQFHPEKVALAKSDMLESIRRKNDEPFDLGRRAFRDVMYGKNHYYAWNPTPASVAQLQQQDLFDLHRKICAPDHAIMAVAGDFDKDALIIQLEELLKDWKPTGRIVPNYDYSLKNPPAGKVFYVDKDYTQSMVYMGQSGFSRHDPDEFPMVLANTILGEGGSSRLFGQIRSRLGLAYVVGSFYKNPTGPGVVGVVSQTKAPSTGAVIQALRAELSKFSSQAPGPEEMSLAKDSTLNAFVFRFDSPEQIVRQRAHLEFYDYPEDYLKTYPDKIRGVKAADILNIAKKYFTGEKMKIAVIGNKSKFEKPLSEWGEVVEIPLASID